MSHVSQYKMRCKDLSALKQVLDSKGISYRENVMTQLYGSNKVNAALEFKLPGWRYSCAVDEEGVIHYDHFGSQSNTIHLLGETVQEYNKAVIMPKIFEFAQNWWEEKNPEYVDILVEC